MICSKIFVYDIAKRITAEEMLAHPWFHMDQDGHSDHRKRKRG